MFEHFRKPMGLALLRAALGGLCKRGIDSFFTKFSATSSQRFSPLVAHHCADDGFLL